MKTEVEEWGSGCIRLGGMGVWVCGRGESDEF
jgi:hypothetical protein